MNAKILDSCALLSCLKPSIELQNISSQNNTDYEYWLLKQKFGNRTILLKVWEEIAVSGYFLVLLFDLIGMLLGSFYGFYVWFMFGHKFLYTVMFYTVMLCFSLLISSNSRPFWFMYVAEIIKRTKIWSLLMNGNKIKWVQIYNFTYSISIPKATPMTTTCPLHWKHSKKSFWDLNMTWRKSRLTNNNH